MIVAKNRSGPIGTSHLIFPHIPKFAEESREHTWPARACCRRSRREADAI